MDNGVKYMFWVLLSADNEREYMFWLPLSMDNKRGYMFGLSLSMDNGLEYMFCLSLSMDNEGMHLLGSLSTADDGRKNKGRRGAATVFEVAVR